VWRPHTPCAQAPLGGLSEITQHEEGKGCTNIGGSHMFAKHPPGRGVVDTLRGVRW
jgi:hypothetical protein